MSASNRLSSLVAVTFVSDVRAEPVYSCVSAEPLILIVIVTLPVAVATFVTLPSVMSDSVTVYSVVNVSVSPAARASMLHSSPVSSSVTLISVIVRELSVLVTVILYAILSPRAKYVPLVVTFSTFRIGRLDVPLFSVVTTGSTVSVPGTVVIS